MRLITRSAAALGAAALAAATSACGSDTLDPGGTTESSQSSVPVTVAKDDKLAALVPDDIRKAGTLTVGTDASYAPNEFTVNGNQIEGMDIDLLTAVGQKLGLKLRFENGNFDSLIGGVTADKYPIAISSFTVNAKRMEAVTMVQYLNAGTSWAVTSGNPEKVDITNPCGLTVGVQKGTVQADDDLPARDKKCKAEGKPGITAVVEDAQSKVTADLTTGKVVAMAADSPVSAWAIAQSNGRLEKVGDIYDAAPYGIVVAKSSTKFAEAISKALASLAEDGTYKKLLDNWGNGEAAVKEFPVNPQVN